VTRSTVVHLTTIDMSLALLLLPQLVGMRDAGFDVVGVSAPGPHVGQLEAEGIRHVPLPRSSRAVDIRGDLASMREFVRICRRLRPDIVHTHNPKPGVYGRIGARLARVPHVVNTVHGLYAQPSDGRLRRTVVYGLERLAATCSDAELVQNPEDLEVLRRLRVPERKLILLGNGVDLRRFDPERHRDARREVRAEFGIADHEIVVGAVGRMVREKGYLELFEAARRVRERHPDVRFVVAGPHDPDKADAVTQAEVDRAAGVADVRFLGMVGDVERLYPALDIYVLASHREGFPRSAMEAAAMGLPIVATDIRGCRQVVDHGRTGVLVPVRSADGLAAAITGLVTDAGRRAAMGAAAREKALSEFDDRRQTETTLEVYRRLLARRRASVPR
jgi:glycosyltransferase involved in cell wall biosynthesis